MDQSLGYDKKMSLQVEIAGVMFPNPVLLASGILGITGSLMKRVQEAGAGGVVTKTFSEHARNGYDNPVIIASPSGLINAIGLPNPGYIKMLQEIEKTNGLKIPLIASIMGDSPYSYASLAGKVEDFGIDAIELNVSCPHVETTGSEIGEHSDTLKRVVREVKSTVKIPVFVKLTPNVTSIIEEGCAAADGGADAVVAINTVKAMSINVETKQPFLSNITGGLSGPAIKPIGLRCVYELYKHIKIPIIGVGGIVTWRDALEYMLAGASCVQVGTGIAYRGLDVFNEINHGISEYLRSEELSSVKEITGLAHTHQ